MYAHRIESSWRRAELGLDQGDEGQPELMIRANPDRFFSPPYAGPSGWMVCTSTKSPDWNELAELLATGGRQ
jgi:hypothetical protein